MADRSGQRMANTVRLRCPGLNTSAQRLGVVVNNVNGSIPQKRCNDSRTTYNVRRTLYVVHCTPYNVYCTTYSVRCTTYIVRCTEYVVRTKPGWLNEYCIHYEAMLFMCCYYSRIYKQKNSIPFTEYILSIWYRMFIYV